MHGRGVCMAGGMHSKGGHIWQKGVHGGRHAWGHAWQGGMCGRGHAWQGVCVAGEMVTAVNGMHPTGMHSCFLNFIKCCHLLFIFALSNLNIKNVHVNLKCIPHIPFEFEFECNLTNGNSATVCHRIAIWPFDRLFPNLTNGNLVTNSQTQTQIEPGLSRIHTCTQKKTEEYASKTISRSFSFSHLV